MKKAIKKFIRDYLRLLFIFSVPWFIRFKPSTGGGEFILLLIILFVVFSLLVLNSSIKLVKEFGKESIYSLFYSVPLSVFYVFYVGFIYSVADSMSFYNYAEIDDFGDFYDSAQQSGLNFLIIFFILKFCLYYILKE